jgi:hypothetical protein
MPAILKKKKAEAEIPAGNSAEISAEELSQRVAVLKRFRELLTEQRNRFRQYLEVLDKQKDLIVRGDAEGLNRHVELEEKILSDIFSIQKVIDPLEAVFQAAVPVREAAEVPSLKASLEDLKNEAKIRLERNKNFLSTEMVRIRKEIKHLGGKSFVSRPSIYADSGVPSLIDISG